MSSWRKINRLRKLLFFRIERMQRRHNLEVKEPLLIARLTTKRVRWIKMGRLTRMTYSVTPS